MSGFEGEGEALPVSSIVESLKKHEAALDALKDVPKLLQQLTGRNDNAEGDSPTDNEDDESLILNTDDLLKTNTGRKE